MEHGEQQTPVSLWLPDHMGQTSTMAIFTSWLNSRQSINVSDYQSLHAWSVENLDKFWGLLTEFFGVQFHSSANTILTNDSMPGAQWFPGATLNYAEHALNTFENYRPSAAPGAARIAKNDTDIAMIFIREDGLEQTLTYGQLRSQVAAMAAGLRELGVGPGDRVAALISNCPQAVVAFLATASIGAIWSSCSPDFGAQAISDRFLQIKPRVLIAVDGYYYGGKTFDISPSIKQLSEQLNELSSIIWINYIDGQQRLNSIAQPIHAWDELLKEHMEAAWLCNPVPFGHPLWILYSSGTTGLPKGIVHSHGGIVVEHLKMLALHSDLHRGERFFWFTTTGWMMWNYLISGLLVGATIVLYDGSPAYPSLKTLWRLAERINIDYLGTSAAYVHACAKRKLQPGDEFDLSRLRALGSTGSPLSTAGFSWIAEAVSKKVQVASLSGGTDLCSGFVGPSPTVPVWLGEISCRALGAAVAAFDEAGREVVDQVGELVITRPMPSMPVSLWDDPDGSRLREAYFKYYPGVWRHGDWIRITPRGSCVIYGRSDATINRGGIRMGTAEFYRVIEAFDEVVDSLVIDTTMLTDTGRLLCFVVLAEGMDLERLEPQLRAALRTELSPRHVPDRFIAIPEVPKTINGKKSEVPVKKILAGVAVEKAVSRDALQNPEALEIFVAMARQR